MKPDHIFKKQFRHKSVTPQLVLSRFRHPCEKEEHPTKDHDETKPGWVSGLGKAGKRADARVHRE